MAQPLPHQLPSIERHLAVLSKHEATLEASIPGFGKTYVAAFVAKRLGLRPVVICPKSVIPHWNAALEECDAEPRLVTNYEQMKLEKFPGYGEWAIRGRRWGWTLPEDTLLVFDEAHRCSDRTTQNAKLLTAVRGQPFKTFMASATIAKDPLDLYAPGFALRLHQGANFIGWAMGHGVRRGPFCFEYKGGIEGLKGLHAELFPEHGYRATYEDIPGFPMNQIEAWPVEVKSPGTLDSLYDRARELEELHADASEAVVARLRARQHAELLKVPNFIELIEDSIREGMSVAVFVNFTDTLDRLIEKFPMASVVSGGQTAFERQLSIEEFQANRNSLILCQSQAGGVGISLHDLHGDHPRASLISPPESARMLIQILGRIHRTGAKTPAIQKIVFASNTVEEKVRRTVERNVKQIETLNDGDLTT